MDMDDLLAASDGVEMDDDDDDDDDAPPGPPAAKVPETITVEFESAPTPLGIAFVGAGENTSFPVISRPAPEKPQTDNKLIISALDKNMKLISVNGEILGTGKVGLTNFKRIYGDLTKNKKWTLGVTMVFSS
jgi:hypothetical protein